MVKKKGRKKDPNAPKRPMTAFLLFAATRRKEVKLADPTATVTSVAKALGEEWRQLGDVERMKFLQLAEKEKEKYDLVKAKYVKMKAAESGPKRPPTAFFLFAKERRSEIKERFPEARVTDVAKILGNEWKNLATSERQRFKDAQEELKKEYEVAKLKWLKKIRKSSL